MSIRKGEKTTDVLLALSDAQINYSDIPELPDDFWEEAKVVTPEIQAGKWRILRQDSGSSR